MTSTVLVGQCFWPQGGIRSTDIDAGVEPAALQEAPDGLTAVQKGHLRCQLQMGHLQSMLAQVDGWRSRCSGAPKSIASTHHHDGPVHIVVVQNVTINNHASTQSFSQEHATAVWLGRDQLGTIASCPTSA